MSVKADAKSRAVRTFLQGLAIDVILVVSASLYGVTSSDDFKWTGAYWGTYALLLSRTVLHTIASYVMAHVKKPQIN